MSRTLACWLVAVSTACSHAAARSAPVAAPAAAPSSLDYTFTLDATLSRLSARVCIHGSAPEYLVYGAPAAMRLLRSPRALRTDGDVALPVLEMGISLRGVPADTCIAYEVDLDAASASDSFYLARRGAGVLLTAPELFLFRPPRRPSGFHARARFVLPQGVQVSSSWPVRDGAHHLDESAFAFNGHVAFGRMEHERVAVPGAVFEVAVLPGFHDATRALIVPWLQTAGAVVASAIGKFPAASAQVIVVPTANPALRFGHAGRSGGPSVVLFVPAAADLDYFRDDWIAVHELSHLLVPFIRREDAWLSEGLATYLQGVLRVRAGLMSPEQLWRDFHQGAQYGLAAQGSLAEETKIMPTAGNYQRVYWAGANITLLGDVELRERTQGKHSLLSALAGVDALRERADRPHSAAEVLAALDAATGQAVVLPLAERLVHAPTFPTLDTLYERLGLRADGSPAEAAADAPLAWIAAAITERSTRPTTLALSAR